MKSLYDHEDICSSCGFNISAYEERRNCLKPFVVLQNKYMIGRVIGVGGFGITYIGWDMNLQTYIAIKEYFPDSYASRDMTGDGPMTQVMPNEAKLDIYNKGLKRYVEEAQNLSKFYQLQGIVSVKDFFYENGTGYIVMEYINGINLKEFLNKSGGRLDEATVLSMMKPVLESLYQIHNSGLIHRDISPDNIMVDGNGKIKLIDFGSARGKSAETDKTYTVILKHGYAPSEQYYAKGNQGAWTDIYSLCATMYKMLTGIIPPNSVERMENDEYIAPSACGVPVSERTEKVIAKGLAVRIADRYQNIGELLSDLYGETPVSEIRTAVPNSIAATNYPKTGTQSMGEQSMHLSMMPDMGEKKVKKNSILPIVIGCSMAGIVALVLVMVMLLGGKKSTDGASSSDAPTATDTQNVSTTEGSGEVNPKPAEEYVYEWPQTLSDDWHDYNAKIDGNLYSFPIPYVEWASKGWRADVLPTYIAAGDSEKIVFYNDRMTITAVAVNYSVNEAPLGQCFIIGFEVDTVTHDFAKDAEVTLAGGVSILRSTETDVKNAYGAPDKISEFGDNKTFIYKTKDGDNAMSLQFSYEGKLVEIVLGNVAVPEGLGTTEEINKEPPEINSKYVAPDGPSVSPEDRIITTDGKNYRLPCPVTEFIDAGWKLDEDTDEYIPAGSYGNTIITNLEKNGSKIEICIENTTRNAILPEHGIITEISYEKEYCDIDIIFPGGLSLKDGKDDDIDALYGGYENYEFSDYSSFISHSCTIQKEKNERIKTNFYTDAEDGRITDGSIRVDDFTLDSE